MYGCTAVLVTCGVLRGNRVAYIICARSRTRGPDATDGTHADHDAPDKRACMQGRIRRYNPMIMCVNLKNISCLNARVESATVVILGH
jgi:hypothetical protein